MRGGGRADDEDSMLCPSALPLRRMRSRSTRAPLHFLDTSPPAHGRGVLRSQVPSPPCAGMQKQKRRIPKDSPFCLGAENGTRTRAAREWFRETLQTPPAPGRGALRSQVPSPLMHRHTKRGKNLSASSLFWSGKRISDSSIFLVHNQRIM